MNLISLREKAHVVRAGASRSASVAREGNYVKILERLLLFSKWRTEGEREMRFIDQWLWANVIILINRESRWCWQWLMTRGLCAWPPGPTNTRRCRFSWNMWDVCRCLLVLVFCCFVRARVCVHAWWWWWWWWRLVIHHSCHRRNSVHLLSSINIKFSSQCFLSSSVFLSDHIRQCRNAFIFSNN